MEDVLVSIRMITYNQEKYISQAVESVLRQKVDFRYELLIGEDASTDRTAEIVDEYQRKYPDIIKVFHRKKNIGIRANGSALIKCCLGKYVAVLEGDDYWDYDMKLQTQINFLEKHENIIAVAHNVRSIDKDGNLLDERYIDFPFQKKYIYNKQNAMKMEFFGHMSSIVYRNIRYLLNKQQWKAYIQCEANNDFKLWITLGMLGNCAYFEEVWSCRRRVFEGEGWTATTYKKNISYFLFEQCINVEQYLKAAFHVNADVSGYLCSIVKQAYHICLEFPTKDNMKMFGKVSVAYLKSFLKRKNEYLKSFYKAVVRRRIEF